MAHTFRFVRHHSHDFSIEAQLVTLYKAIAQELLILPLKCFKTSSTALKDICPVVSLIAQLRLHFILSPVFCVVLKHTVPAITSTICFLWKLITID